MFGNSVSSNEASDRKSDYFTKSFTSLVTRTLYSVELDYDDIAASGAWTEDFIIACSALGQHSGQKRLLEFISKYGTHGLATASLGKRCRSTLYMEGVGRREDYQQLRNKVETNDKGVYLTPLPSFYIRFGISLNPFSAAFVCLLLQVGGN